MDIVIVLFMSALAAVAVVSAWIDDRRQREERRRMAEDIARLRRDVEELRTVLNGENETDGDPAPPRIVTLETAAGSVSVPGHTLRPHRSVYPELEVVPLPSYAALRALPEAGKLPSIGADGIRWAWNAAEFRRGEALVVPGAEIPPSAPPIFVLGDLHGDAASLRRILAYAFSVSPEARVVFLGDLMDRSPGLLSLECARLFLWAARTHPGRFLWLRGNHDFLAWNKNESRFCTSVEPYEFVDFLNDHPEFRGEGIALGEIMSTLPVGAVLGNVWLSHGGVLQDDGLGTRAFSGFSAMADEMKHDLVWSRMRDVPTKHSFRGSSGAEVGLRQAQTFVRRIEETDGVEIEHIVCAHQHESRDGVGYLPYDRCFTNGLTCQCVCSFENAAALDGTAAPAFLRIDCGKAPVPVCFGPVAPRADSGKDEK